MSGTRTSLPAVAPSRPFLDRRERRLTYLLIGALGPLIFIGVVLAAAANVPAQQRPYGAVATPPSATPATPAPVVITETVAAPPQTRVVTRTRVVSAPPAATAPRDTSSTPPNTGPTSATETPTPGSSSSPPDPTENG